MTERQWMYQIRERINRFKSIPGVRIPIYESHAGVDFGRYLGIIREDGLWRSIDVDFSRSDYSPLAEERSEIAQHVVQSVQEIEELLNIIERLYTENQILKGKLRFLYGEMHNICQNRTVIKEDIEEYSFSPRLGIQPSF